MIRRAYIIGMLAIGLVAATIPATPTVCRFVSSARSFHGYFRILGESGSAVSPLERLIFSLVLANPKAEANVHAAPQTREAETVVGPVIVRHT